MENTETRQAALRAAMEESRWDVVAYLIVSGIEGVQKRLRAVIAKHEAERETPEPPEPEDCVAHRMRAMRYDTDHFPGKDESDTPAKVCYSRFTDRARKVMQLANQESQRFNHEYVGTEHVLLAVAKVGDGVAAKIIKEHGIDPLKIRPEVEKLVQVGPAMVTMGKLPQTPRVKRAIELAANEATQLGVNYVGDEHILLGLLHDSESVAGSVLASLGMTLDRARSMLRELTCEPEQPAPAQAGDIPEWFVSLVKWIHDDGFGCGDDNSREAATAIGQLAVVPKAWAKAESEIARRVAEATKERDAETQKSRRLALEWGDKLTQRDAEIERLKESLASEKKSRIEYQEICYEACSVLDNKKPVDCTIDQIVPRIKKLRHQAFAAHAESDTPQPESQNPSGRAELLAEIERLKAKLAKWESEPVGKMIAELRDEERESKNRDIAKLKAELAEATKPVELESANIRELDGMKMIYLGDAQAAVRGERAARFAAERRACKAEGFMRALSQLAFTLCRRWHVDEGHSAANVNECREGWCGEFAKINSDTGGMVLETAKLVERADNAEQRLALTREAWRHRWVSHDGALGPKLTPLTDADIDAAIEAHEKSKADAAGGGE